MAGSTEVGDRFRDQIAELLQAAGYSVTTEILIGHKRVDLTFEQTQFGKVERFALEAKNWNRPLDHSDLEQIYGGYASLLQNGVINKLLIVSFRDLTSPAAKAFVQQTQGLAHLSYRQFQESIMGFETYLRHVVADHESGGLEDYYVPPRLDNGTLLEAHIAQWLAAEIAQPIAILAGYGMGKTSFAHHLSYELARNYLQGGLGRIPVLVSLGAISREQSLEGLIGGTLTGRSPSVRNYSFPLFAHLNKLGQFLVILDGFDEMKHMMTWSEFQTNFDEFNRLSIGMAKLLLLGRPSAFLSEEEESYVLRGARKLGRIPMRSLEAITYSQLVLAPFSAVQAREFIDRYLVRHGFSESTAEDDNFLATRRLEIENGPYENLISRPIHARMLADIARNPEVDITNISRFTLYDSFIQDLLDREAKKPGRGKLFKAEDRRAFARELAWWLWTKADGTSVGCRLDDLPNHLFKPYCMTDADLAGARRDLLSASFLEAKPGGIFYFAHRSFQEFLVAEHIWNVGIDRNNIGVVSRAINAEVFGFINERGDRDFFSSVLNTLRLITASSLDKSPIRITSLPIEFVNHLSTSGMLCDLARDDRGSAFSPWAGGLLITSMLRTHISAGAKIDFDLLDVIILRAAAEVGRKKPTHTDISNRYLAPILFLLEFACYFAIDLDVVIPAVVYLLFSRAESHILRPRMVREQPEAYDALANVVFGAVTGSKGKNNELLITLDIGELFSEVKNLLPLVSLEGGVSVDLVNRRYTRNFGEFFGPLETRVPGRLKKLREFYEADATSLQTDRQPNLVQK